MAPLLKDKTWVVQTTCETFEDRVVRFYHGTLASRYTPSSYADTVLEFCRWTHAVRSGDITPEQYAWAKRFGFKLVNIFRYNSDIRVYKSSVGGDAYMEISKRYRT